MKKISLFIGIILILGSTCVVAEGSHKISGHVLNSDKLLELEPEYHTYSEVVSELYLIGRMEMMKLWTSVKEKLLDLRGQESFYHPIVTTVFIDIAVTM